MGLHQGCGLWHALRGVVCSLHYEVWSTLGGVVYTRGCGLYLGVWSTLGSVVYTRGSGLH